MKFSQKEVSQFTLREMLVALACQGAFFKYSLPDWAEGTRLAEVWDALLTLGSYCESRDGSVPEGFDEWFDSYCNGREVCHPREIGKDDDDEEDF